LPGLAGGYRKFHQLFSTLCTGSLLDQKSPLLGQLTWPLKHSVQQQQQLLLLPAALKPAGSSPNFLSGHHSKYQRPNAAIFQVQPPPHTPFVLSQSREQLSEPVEILPHLLLGCELHASQRALLQRMRITALLNVSHTCPNHFESEFTYKCIPVQDCAFEDIAVHFHEAIAFIGKV
jgi:hypothetical protein